MGDKGYGSNAPVMSPTGRRRYAHSPRKSRKNLHSYDWHLYRFRHLGDNTFLELKRWRGIATRYAKGTASFLAAVNIRGIAIWDYNRIRTLAKTQSRRSCCRHCTPSFGHCPRLLPKYTNRLHSYAKARHSFVKPGPVETQNLRVHAHAPPGEGTRWKDMSPGPNASRSSPMTI